MKRIFVYLSSIFFIFQSMMIQASENQPPCIIMHDNSKVCLGPGVNPPKEVEGQKIVKSCSGSSNYCPSGSSLLTGGENIKIQDSFSKYKTVKIETPSKIELQKNLKRNTSPHKNP